MENYIAETSVRADSFSGAHSRRETLRRRQIYVGYNYQHSWIKKHVKTQDEFSLSWARQNFILPKQDVRKN